MIEVDISIIHHLCLSYFEVNYFLPCTKKKCYLETSNLYDKGNRRQLKTPPDVLVTYIS